MELSWKGSPNFDRGRGDKKLDKIIIHWFGVGTLDGANARFQNASERASAHYGISDNMVYQWVREEDTAWHCGVYQTNQESIGIENDATTTKKASEETYKTCIELVRAICQRHAIPIDRDHILKHSEVSASQCPGTFDIERIVREAKTNQPSDLDLCRLRKTELEKDIQMKEQFLRDRDDEITQLKAGSVDFETKIEELQNALQTAQNDLRDTSNSYVAKVLLLENEVSDLQRSLTEIITENNELKTAAADYENHANKILDRYTGWGLVTLGLKKMFAIERGRG